MIHQYRRIHISPVDDKHQIEVWENDLGNRYFMPHYSRTGRTWASYMSHGQRVACTSYASAMRHIKRASNERQPRVLQSTWN